MDVCPFELIQSIHVGQFHIFFVDSDGSVWGAGDNSDGQLGVGDEKTRDRLTQVIDLPPISSIACGYRHSLFLDTDGYVWVCGYNRYGQLGINNYSCRNVPVRLENLPTIKAISCLQDFSLFLDDNGEVWGSGNNQFGQLGLGPTKKRSTIPEKLPGISVKIAAISAGVSHSLFLGEDGCVWGCGLDYEGPTRLRNAPQTYYPHRLEYLPGNCVAIQSSPLHNYSMVLDANHSIWGVSALVQPGQPDFAFVETAPAIDGIPVAAIFCGNQDFCLSLEGTVHYFRSNCAESVVLKNVVVRYAYSGEGYVIFVDIEGCIWLKGELPFTDFYLLHERTWFGNECKKLTEVKMALDVPLSIRKIKSANNV